MTLDPQRLKDIFGDHPHHIRPLGACVFGSAIAFDDFFTDISPIFCYGAKLHTYNSELCDLVDEVGVLVLENATAKGLVANLLISSAVRDSNTLKQDPFHRDGTKGFTEGITVLHNPYARSRHAPTIYATKSAVRAAIARYQETTEITDTETQQALTDILDPSYSFNLMAQEAYARRVMLNNRPDFTTAVADLIPPDQKYIHAWGPGKACLVLHSNRPDFILHARPESQDRDNPLKAIGVRRF